MRDSSRIAILTLLLLGFVGGALPAQTISIEGILGVATHEDIGRSAGIEASIDFGLLAFGILAFGGTLRRFDTPCGGFIAPTGC